MPRSSKSLISTIRVDGRPFAPTVARVIAFGSGTFAPVAVVCAGPKAILDLPLTLEVLETHGVPVVGLGTDTLPGFYTRSSGLRIDVRVETPLEAAAIIAAAERMEARHGVLVVVPVPEDKRDAYRELAAKMAKVFRANGASRVVEAIGDDVQHGKVTDFYRAVKAEDGETVVFSFIEWPDKSTRDEAWKAIMADESLKPTGEMPFNGQRMFWGGFDKIVDSAESQPISQGAAPITA